MGDKLPTIKKASIKKPRKPQKIKIEHIKETEYKQRKKPKQKRLNRKLMNQAQRARKAYARELEKEEQLKRRQGEDILRRMTSTARKDRTKQEALIKKAKDVLKLAENRVQDARYQGMNVNVLFNFEYPRYHIQYLEDQIKAGKGLSDDDKRYLKEHGHPTHYDKLIKYEFTIEDKSRASEGFIPVKTKYVSQYEINRLKKKQANAPDTLTEEETDIVVEWSIATNRANEANKVSDNDVVDVPEQAPTETDEEYIAKREKMVRRLNVTRSVEFGGNSTLINALAYTMGCRPVGPKIVALVQNAMKDPVMWNRIESWYRNSVSARSLLERGTGNDWYDSVVHHFLPLFIEMLNELKNVLDIDDDLIDEAEILAAEYEV